jgi:hypothetical protein
MLPKMSGIASADRASPPQKGSRAAEFLLFFTVLLATSYFYNGTGANQNARLDTVYALVEGDASGASSFRIDEFVIEPAKGVNTKDWAQANGHYYSNKAPGAAILAAPAYYLLVTGERLFGQDSGRYSVALLNAYLVNVWISCVPSALAALALFRLARRLPGHSSRDALIAALVYGLGTLILPFGTQFWGHNTAAAFLLMGTLFLSTGSRSGNWAAGLAFGLAVTVEYLSAITLVSTAAFMMADRSRRLAVPRLLLGAVCPLFLLALFHRVNFGGWATTAAALSNPGRTNGDAFTTLSLRALAVILMTPYRGLILFSPVLVFACVGARRALQPTGDPLLRFALMNLALYLIAVACYTGWDGGQATGPRYLIPSLGFWVLLLPAWSSLRVKTKVVAAVLGVVSCLNMLAIAAVDPMVRKVVSNPLYGFVLPHLLRGDLNAKGGSFYHFFSLSPSEARQGAFNLGRFLTGSWGTISLIPLVLLLTALVYTGLHVESARAATPPPSSIGRDGDETAGRTFRTNLGL